MRKAGTRVSRSKRDRSLICDLLRGTEWEVLLGWKMLRREFPAIRSSGQATVEVIPLELRRLQQLALADDFMAELIGDFAQARK